VGLVMDLRHHDSHTVVAAAMTHLQPYANTSLSLGLVLALSDIRLLVNAAV
jgi:hypothetical protein